MVSTNGDRESKRRSPSIQTASDSDFELSEKPRKRRSTGSVRTKSTLVDTKRNVASAAAVSDPNEIPSPWNLLHVELLALAVALPKLGPLGVTCRAFANHSKRPEFFTHVTTMLLSKTDDLSRLLHLSLVGVKGVRWLSIVETLINSPSLRR